MNVDIYIQGQKVEQFDDETITINRTVKNISDISKVFTDFTQSFTVPASSINNDIFKHWYNNDVDNGFNSLLRVDAHIEIKTLPFKYGSIQLNSAKLKNGLPYAYDITFFGKSVNLSDLFGDDLLSSLDLSDYDHSYNETTVTDAMNSNTIASGDIYYPLISAVTPITMGTDNATDILKSDNAINWLDFKPALRHLRIIEAIETKYNVEFSRIFFDRAVFFNYFMWLHAKEGRIEAFGTSITVDINTDDSGLGFDFDATDNTITYDTQSSGSIIYRYIIIQVIPSVGYESVPYQLSVYNDGELITSVTKVGTDYLQVNPSATTNIITYEIAPSQAFAFTTNIIGRRRTFSILGYTYEDKTVSTAEQSINPTVTVSEQMPELKIKDYFKSIIAEFNLIIEFENNIFNIDTLDNWYNNGKFYNITKYVDIDEITIKKPDAKKQINFLYQETEAILGAKYLNNTSVGYGDLKAEYSIDGSALTIETEFENMMFERLQNRTTEQLSDIQVGYAVDKNLEPYIGAPFNFYKNGFAYSVDDLIIQNSATLNKAFHTATEDNILFNQVTSSLNFGSDNSTFFQVPIEQSLYYNFYKTYIDDLYNQKTRVVAVKCYLPVAMIYKLNLNDKIIISDKKYKISSYTINLTTRETNFELFTDLGQPADSVANEFPLTVDSDLITVDSDLITVDAVSTHVPIISYINNGISASEYTSTASNESFEIKITANTNWSISKVDLGDGVSWFDVNKFLGKKSYYIRVSLLENFTASNRQGKITVTIGGVDYDLTILQLA